MTAKEFLFQLNHHRTCIATYGKLLRNHHVRNFFHFHTSTFDRRKTDTYLSCPLHQFKITQHSNVKEYFKAPAFRYTAAHLFSYVAQESDASHLRNREKICWKCRQKLTSMSKHFCENCDSILPISDAEDYFSMLGVKKDFNVSISELQFNFRQHQVLLHPDKFSLKSDLEKRLSESISAEVNKAYFTLLKPLTRGVYMLELNGVFITESVTSEDPALLMEIMEVNEKVANTKSASERREVRDDIKENIDKLTNSIAEAFHKNDIPVAHKLVIKYKYYDNAYQKLREMLV